MLSKEKTNKSLLFVCPFFIKFDQHFNTTESLIYAVLIKIKMINFVSQLTPYKLQIILGYFLIWASGITMHSNEVFPNNSLVVKISHLNSPVPTFFVLVTVNQHLDFPEHLHFFSYDVLL